MLAVSLCGTLALFAPVRAAAHAPAVHAKKTAAKPHQSRHSRRHRARRRSSSWKRHGQQHIDSDRARDIQEALIRDNYMAGQPSGIWDTRTKEAMSRYQGDHGWQTKMLPDSRALIALGLGPRRDNLLNPDTAVPAGGPAISAPAPSVPR